MNIFQKFIYNLNPSLYYALQGVGAQTESDAKEVLINQATRIEFDAKAQITGNDGYWLVYVETTKGDFDGLMEVSTRFYVTVDGIRFYLETEFDCNVEDDTRALIDVQGCTFFEISRATDTRGNIVILSMSLEAERQVLKAIASRLKNERWAHGMPDYDNL